MGQVSNFVPDSKLACSVFDIKMLSIRVAVVLVMQLGLVIHGNILSLFRFSSGKFWYFHLYGILTN